MIHSKGYIKRPFCLISPSSINSYLIMSDAGRKDISDKVSSAVKPDSQKSTFELAKDKVTDTIDNFVGDNSRSGDKSATQQASDAVFGEKK